MPDVMHSILSEARASIYKLSKDIKIDESDATSSKRGVWDADNWIVCSQTPAAKEKINESAEISLTYARDKNECEGKKSTESSTSSNDLPKLPSGLTESIAQSKCEESFDNNKSLRNYKLRTLVGKHSQIMHDGDEETWQFNIEIKDNDGNYVGEYMCRVIGTEDAPILKDVKILN